MRKTRERYNLVGFSLSFLDCICCGFGAIILLLVLTKIGEPRALEELRIPSCAKTGPTTIVGYIAKLSPP